MFAASAPGWAQYLAGFAGFTVVVSVLWSKVFLPGFRAANRADRLIDTVTRVEKMMPALEALTAQLHEATNLVPFMRAIYDQFHTDGGSTLKDQMNLIEDDGLRLAGIVERLTVAVARIEAGNKVVAENLADKENP